MCMVAAVMIVFSLAACKNKDTSATEPSVIETEPTIAASAAGDVTAATEFEGTEETRASDESDVLLAPDADTAKTTVVNNNPPAPESSNSAPNKAPVTNPPAAAKPSNKPAATEPPVAETPDVQVPATEPPATEPPAAEPPVNTPEPEPAEPEAAPTEPAACQHEWNMQYYPEVGHYGDWYKMCSCGYRFQNIGEYDGHLNSVPAEDLATTHASWASNQDWIVDSPEYREWTCSKCGTVTRTQP